MQKRHIKLVLAATLVVGLSGCGSVKKELGVGRHSPDEFLVVKRAPLTIPPDYTLRPPAPAGATTIASVPETDMAKEAVLGKMAAPPANTADQTLLEKLGISTADADIRRKIDEENGYLALENRSVAQKLIFWDDKNQDIPPDNIPTTVVDPRAEAARLKKNKEEGKPANEGTVPVIEKKQNTLDKIF